MRWYLDASVALHAVLSWGDERAERWFRASSEGGDEIISSSLLRLEVIRALRRERLDIADGRWLLDRVEYLRLHDGVLAFAENIEPHVRSLDAIHLASAAMLGTSVVVVTHDDGMREVASHLGLETLDPVTG